MPVQTNDPPHPRLLMIGFDGATLDLILPWVKAGYLPHFARLLAQGAHGPLESTVPPVTPAAWSSLATGLNPGKHGIFDFYARRPNSYETCIVNARDRHGATLWELLSQAGLRTTVFNVPATYPPDRVNGAMVSGLLTPASALDASSPPELLDELKRAVPGFNFYPPGIFSKGQEVEFVSSILDWDEMTLQATQFLMNREPWDFFFTVFIGTDIVSHFMWRHMVTRGACVTGADPTVRDKLANAILSVYRHADEILGKLTAAVDKDTYIMVVSDHGFGALDHYMHLNAWLVQHGYMKFKPTLGVTCKAMAYRLGLTPLNLLDLARRLGMGASVQHTASKHNDWLRSMVKRVFLSFDDIDWSRTTAYTRGYSGPIFANLQGREPQGFIHPGEQFEKLVKQIESDLREFKHPVTGLPFVQCFVRPSDLYTGPFARDSFDIGFFPSDWTTQVYGVHDFASNRPVEPSPDRTGTHRMNGVFFLRGPRVKAEATVEHARLIDIAPSVLGLMGVPIPKNMDGRFLSTALASAPQIHFVDSQASDRAEVRESGLSDEDDQIIRERLEALGYF